ncbi:hypothetical protein PY365_18595 [Roseiarcaceae bacterium H3SJ34-1]|uniref:hypothetical protein n=1 Tax=Terripilifer ovatus TaxID=3032367 RepID=UPI003AB9742C|nr:hypothetical protein [Roseiarcaceae bacterium H3SJ34-1]
MTRVERRKFRQRMFRETLAQRLGRLLSDTGRVLGGGRNLPRAVDFFFRSAMIRQAGLPTLDNVLATPDGFAGVISDLAPDAVVEGYANGFFPRWILGQATWWSPALRHVREPDGERLAALRRQHGDMGFCVTLDRDFEAVAAACAHAGAPHDVFHLPPAALHLFARLHDQGFAHCFAVRDRTGRLVAGGFGVTSGRIYTTERVFESAPGALALGLATLDAHLADWRYRLHDLRADNAETLGFRPMAREPFMLLCAASQNGGCPGRWSEAENVPLADAFRSETFTSAA